MQSLIEIQPAVNASFPPITRLDLARAAMWKLRLPDAPQAVEAPADSGDSWDTWDDATDLPWSLGPHADPIEAPALAADDEAAAGPAEVWVNVTPFVQVLVTLEPTRAYHPRTTIEAEGPRPTLDDSYTPTRWEDDRAAALFARPSRRPAPTRPNLNEIRDEDSYPAGCCS